jgi:photosystem II stability/assembly factor-like uncharacterized protein
LSATALAVDPHQHRTLFAFADGELLRSSDAGGSFEMLPFPGEQGRLLLPPGQVGTLIVVAERTWISRDRGGDWREIDALVGARQMVVDRDHGGALYALTAQHAGGSDSIMVRVWRSIDGGSSWHHQGTVPPKFPFRESFGGIELVHASASTLLAVVHGNPTTTRFLRSTDAGKTWAAVTTPTPVADALLDPQRPGWMVIAGLPGLLFSEDFGASWEDSGARPHPVAVFALALTRTPIGEERLLAGPYARTAGESWSEITLPTSREVVRTYAVSPADASVVYAHLNDNVFGDGLASSDDGGLSWRGLSSSCDQVSRLAADAVDPLTVYLTRSLCAQDVIEGLVRSTDGGATWQPFSPYTFVDDLETSVADGAPVVFVAAGDQLARTTDGGATWETETVPELEGLGLEALEADPGDPNCVVFGTGDGVLFRKCLGGSPAESLWTSPTGEALDSLLVAADGETIVASSGGLFRPNALLVSLDGGASFRREERSAFLGLRSSTPLPSWQFLFDEATSVLFAAGEGGLFARTVDRTPETCEPTELSACLGNGRFRVEAAWRTSQDEDRGRVFPITGDTTAFWFFDQGNLEYIMKALDGCGVNDHHWVLDAGLTDVEVTVVVSDRDADEVRSWINPIGRALPFGADVNAFNCP